MTAVKMAAISKKFGKVQALENVDLAVQRGSIHAVVGENGAGKTTLMRCLFGAHSPDHGTIAIHGTEMYFRNAGDAIDHGIGMVSQHYSVIPELTCLENLILGAEGAPFLHRRKALDKAEQHAQTMGFVFDWDREAVYLGPAGSQKLEILKLLWRNAEILILDEPTAMLSPTDGAALFANLRQLANSGKTVILVTHRLPEVFDHCEMVTVLRGGKHVGSWSVADVTPAGLAEAIVGHPLPEQKRPPLQLGPLLAETHALQVHGDRGDVALQDVNLTIRTGEMVGIAGVDGSGQRELFQAIVGIRRVDSGRIELEGELLNSLPPARRIELGLRLIPEDRHTEGVIEEWSLIQNGCLGLQRTAALHMGPWINPTLQVDLAQRISDRFGTRHGGLHLPMRSLSGGNQQRFVAARAMQLNPRLILAFQPTRGLDIDGSKQVYGALRKLCRDGAAALVVSFDLDELIEECDKVVVLNRGRMYVPPEEQSHDKAVLGKLMVGAA